MGRTIKKMRQNQCTKNKFFAGCLHQQKQRKKERGSTRFNENQHQWRTSRNATPKKYPARRLGF